MNKITLHAKIANDATNQRLDQALAELFPEYSRAQHQEWVKSGCVTVDGSLAQKPREKVSAGQEICIEAELAEKAEWLPQDLPLSIVYEDEDILVINKPVNMVVHPGAGVPDGTLLNALLHYCPSQKFLPRAGIVHRLDKDTTGLMVVAKTLPAHTALVDALQTRTIKRMYQAIVVGCMTAGGSINEPIGRHPRARTMMAVVSSGKPAVTHYRIEERFRAHTALKIALETGRTHQIRVHLAHLRYPIVGDPVYGRRLQLPKGISEALQQSLQSFKRQALHAYQLGLKHPISGVEMSWQQPLPDDHLQLLKDLREDFETMEQP